MTAERATADTIASQHLRLITYAHLSKLDPRTEDRREILHERAEIHTTIRRKVKQYLTAVEGILYIDQLHLEIMLTNLLLTDLIGLLLLRFVVEVALIILSVRLTDHFLQRLYDFRILRLTVSHHDETILDTTCRFHDGMLSAGEVDILRIEVVYLPGGSESNSNYFCHIFLILSHFIYWYP